MAISGKLEITIKITDFPTASTVENGWKYFEVECDGQTISVNIRPKVWKKLEDAQANFPLWVAAITGKMGEATERGFLLLERISRCSRRKPKNQQP
jgi:hypothetical protein